MTEATPSPTDLDEEEAIAALRNPAGLLVDALMRVSQGDMLMLEAAADPVVDALEQAMYRVESAKAVVDIATAAAQMADAYAYAYRDESADEPEVAVDDSHARGPEPVQGVRFTATLTGRKLGIVGNAPWLWVPGVGFLAGHSGLFTGGDEDGEGGCLVTLAGRVVSSTPEQALCVTDGGRSVALPHSAIDSQDEDER